MIEESYKLKKDIPENFYLANFCDYLKEAFGEKPFTRDQAVEIFRRHTCQLLSWSRFDTLLVNDIIVRDEIVIKTRKRKVEKK